MMRRVPYWLSKCVSGTTFGAVKFGWWSTVYEADCSPIIIGGSPRTGSTLLRVMFDSHPDIWIGPENGVFQEGGRNIPGMQACLGVSAATLQSLYRRSACLGEFVDRTMHEAIKVTGKTRWGIKSPSVVHALPVVFRFFPKARFIHIIRDGGSSTSNRGMARLQ